MRRDGAHGGPRARRGADQAHGAPARHEPRRSRARRLVRRFPICLLAAARGGLMPVQSPPVKKERTDDRQVNTLQASANAWFYALTRVPFLFGAQYVSTGTAGQTKQTAHGLGRVPQGFLLLKASKAPALYTLSSDAT